VQPVLLEAAQREALDGKAVDARAVGSTGRLLVVRLGHRAGGIGRADPHSVPLAARVLQYHRPTRRRPSDQVDAVDGDGQRIELAGCAFAIAAGLHFDGIAGVRLRQRGADRSAGMHHQRPRLCRSGHAERGRQNRRLLVHPDPPVEGRRLGLRRM